MNHETTKRMISEKKNALERMESLEKVVPQILTAVGKQMDEVNRKVSEMAEILDAVIGTIGADKVGAALLETRQRKAVEEAETQKKETNLLVEQGVLVPQDTVTEDSVVIASEEKPDGSPVGAGWFRFQMHEIKPEFREQLMGKQAGFAGTFENGNRYQIQQIYKIDGAKATIHMQQSESPAAEA